MSETSPENENTDEVVRADVPGASDSDMRTLTLAHPLTKRKDFDALGLPIAEDADGNVKALAVGTKVSVLARDAQSLIGAGYAAGVDPDNPKAVRAAIRGEHGNKEQGIDVQPSAGSAEALTSKDQPSANEAANESGSAGASAPAGSTGDAAGGSAAAVDSAAAPAATKTAAAQRGGSGTPKS